MARSSKGNGKSQRNGVALSKRTRIQSCTKQGIKTALSTVQFMNALACDLADNVVTPQMANAICNATGKALQVVAMQYKLGQPIGRRVGARKPVNFRLTA